MRTALKAKNKLGFVDRTLEKLAINEGDFTEYHAWDMVNFMICSWLLNVIDRKLRPSVTYTETTKAMWEDLQKSQILASEPLPPLEKIFNIVTQEEQHKKLMVGRDDRTETAAAFAVNHEYKFQPSTEKGTCKHCDHFGHEVANCFEIIGHPPGWGSRGKGRGRNRGSQTSGNGDIGGGREVAYTAAHIVSGQQAQEQSNNALFGLTNDQLQRLLSLIEPSKPGYEKLAGPHLEEPDWSG